MQQLLKPSQSWDRLKSEVERPKVTKSPLFNAVETHLGCSVGKMFCTRAHYCCIRYCFTKFLAKPNLWFFLFRFYPLIISGALHTYIPCQSLICICLLRHFRCLRQNLFNHYYDLLYVSFFFGDKELRVNQSWAWIRIVKWSLHGNYPIFVIWKHIYRKLSKAF